LSGQLVHAAETVEEMFVRAGSRPARSIASVVPDVPPKLAEVIDRALAFKREDRFATAAEMRAALEEARQAQGGLETLPLTTSQRATQSVESQETLPVDVGLTLPRIATTRVGPRIAAVALVVGLAGGLAFSLTQRGGNANATPSAQASVVVTSSAPPPPKVEVASAVITAAPSVALAPSAAVIPPLVSAALSAAVKPASPPVAHPHATAQATAKPDLYAP
jgi:serine/threonine-protein kinase